MTRPQGKDTPLSQEALVPYGLELLRVFFVVGLAPRLFLANSSALVDELNCWGCSLGFTFSVATLVALQALSRVPDKKVRRSWLPWALVCQTAVLGLVCAWGLSGKPTC